jgi:4-oxalocrotonate tautomerase
MPLIEVHLVEKVFNPEQKRQIIQKLTDAMVSIEGENMRGVTWVKISEVASGEWVAPQRGEFRKEDGELVVDSAGHRVS